MTGHSIKEKFITCVGSVTSVIVILCFIMEPWCDGIKISCIVTDNDKLAQFPVFLEPSVENLVYN